MSIFSNASANSKCGKMVTNGKARWKARMVKGCSLYCSCTFSIGLKCFNVKCGGNNKTTIKKQTKWCSMQPLYLVLPQAWASLHSRGWLFLGLWPGLTSGTHSCSTLAAWEKWKAAESRALGLGSTNPPPTLGRKSPDQRPSYACLTHPSPPSRLCGCPRFS